MEGLGRYFSDFRVMPMGGTQELSKWENWGLQTAHGRGLALALAPNH